MNSSGCLPIITTSIIDGPASNMPLFSQSMSTRPWLAVFSAMCLANIATSTPPNVILILADDMAVGDRMVVGNYHGFNIYSVAGEVPQLIGSVVCPGGQGDVSIVGDLLIMSVEQTRGRVDCGREGRL